MVLIRVYQQWAYFSFREGIHQIWPNYGFKWLNTEVAYIQKLVQYMPNPVTSGIGARGGITGTAQSQVTHFIVR